jgi:hypothetical protein
MVSRRRFCLSNSVRPLAHLTWLGNAAGYGLEEASVNRGAIRKDGWDGKWGRSHYHRLTRLRGGCFSHMYLICHFSPS